jgi:hypothetical protein
MTFRAPRMMCSGSRHHSSDAIQTRASPTVRPTSHAPQRAPMHVARATRATAVGLTNLEPNARRGRLRLGLARPVVL